MINLYYNFLRLLRKICRQYILKKYTEIPECEQDADVAALLIYNALISDKPCMIARFGSTELACLNNYISVKFHKREYLNYIKGKIDSWWWNDAIIKQMQQWSGFFPPTQQKIEQFCNLMLQEIPHVDILGSYLASETKYESYLGVHTKINLELLNPYFSHVPWTKALEGKRVLVVHPFAQTIKEQYMVRERLFKNNLLPSFQLLTIKAVQTIAGIESEFADWFEALESMKLEIDNTEYDICLIGCGAYGFPLAAHVKRRGKKAVHLGGSLQLLFGIKGSRWERENYNVKYNYTKLINEYWVKPGLEEKPKNAHTVENACYW